MLAGEADEFIAPVSGCRTVFEALGGDRRRFVSCGPRTGFGKAYGHAGIISSRAAVTEIFPLVLNWMDETGQ